jgi:hypothetical protein
MHIVPTGTADLRNLVLPAPALSYVAESFPIPQRAEPVFDATEDKFAVSLEVSTLAGTNSTVGVHVEPLVQHPARTIAPRIERAKRQEVGKLDRPLPIVHEEASVPHLLLEVIVDEMRNT